MESNNEVRKRLQSKRNNSMLSPEFAKVSISEKLQNL